jgi:prepilin-type N-terminal cleavage/methylation domain-containing protein
MKNKRKQIIVKATLDKSKKRSRGFSFIEVMVVIIILGLLSSIVGVYLFDSAEKAKVDATTTQIRGLETHWIFIACTIPAIPHQNRDLKHCWTNRKWE